MRKVSGIIAFMAIFVGFVSCREKSEYFINSGIVWNTTYSIVYDSKTDCSDSIVATLNRVEASLSPFRDDSKISAINKNLSDDVDSLITAIFFKSQEINGLSNGMFDPTVAPLINLWGFGYNNSDAEPTDEMIAQRLASVGISDCRIDDGKIVKKSPATEFNFSAITKGFGCDEVGRALQRLGCENYMVEIGGELSLRGLSPRGTPWRVMVDAPIDTIGVVHERAAVIEATDCGIATSGNYRNFKDTPDGRYGHTISPLTGRPVKTEILSATVVAPDAMTADALATASMAMPLELAREIFTVLGEGYGALFILAGDGENRWEIITTAEFPELQ